MSPTASFQIVAAAPEDIPALAALMTSAISPSWDEAALRALLSDGRSSVLVAKAAPGSALAVAGVIRTVVDEAELLLLAASPERRGMGLGGLLLDALSEGARQAGAARMFLEVAADNAPALALYRSRAFTEVGRRAGYYRRPSGAVVDAVLLARDLGQLR